jgi:hypothetical protein
MNWRRGLCLAGINLVAAILLVRNLELRDLEILHDQEAAVAEAAKEAAAQPPEPAKAETAGSDKEEEAAVSFNPCEMWGRNPVQIDVVGLGNIPAYALTAWRGDCPPGWSLSRMMHDYPVWPITPTMVAVRRRVDMAMCIVIFLQWVLIGSIQKGRWRSDPGVLITVCTVVGTCLALFPVTEEAARLPAPLAACGWLWMIGLISFQTLRFLWRRGTRLIARQRS